MSYRRTLFERYHDTHLRHLGEGDEARLEWFRSYVGNAYLPHLPPPEDAPAILDVGCSRGALLAALRDVGYDEISGVDLSEADVRVARDDRGLPDVHAADAEDFLAGRPGRYDVIIAKAVLEHVDKDRVIPFLETIASGLRPGGLVVIDVPNMDWLFASHERYMDFTHEVGFTRESLGQVLRAVFESVSVHPVEQPAAGTYTHRYLRPVLWPLLRRVFSFGFALMGTQGEETLWAYRSIVGIAVRPAGGEGP